MVKLPRTRILGSDEKKYEYYTLRKPTKEMQEVFGAKPDCWIWRGGLTTYGYGYFTSSWYRNEGGSDRVHLYVLSQVMKQELSPDQETDHKCRFRPCSNPDHLERVDQRTNTLRGISPTAENSKKTHCPEGHEYTEENTYTNDKGWRTCRTCSIERMSEYNSRPEVKKARVENYIPKTGVRGKGQWRAVRDACDEGHPLEGDNLVIEKIKHPDGKIYEARMCRECKNRKAREAHARRMGAKRNDPVEMTDGTWVTREDIADILGINRNYAPTFIKRQVDFPSPVHKGGGKRGQSVWYTRASVERWNEKRLK